MPTLRIKLEYDVEVEPFWRQDENVWVVRIHRPGISTTYVPADTPTFTIAFSILNDRERAYWPDLYKLIEEGMAEVRRLNLLAAL